MSHPRDEEEQVIEEIYGQVVSQAAAGGRDDFVKQQVVGDCPNVLRHRGPTLASQV